MTRGKVRAARAAQLVAEAAVGVHAQALKRQAALLEPPLLAPAVDDEHARPREAQGGIALGEIAGDQFQCLEQRQPFLQR